MSMARGVQLADRTSPMPATLPQISPNKELFTRERRRHRMQNFLQSLEGQTTRSRVDRDSFLSATSAARISSDSRAAFTAAR